MFPILTMLGCVLLHQGVRADPGVNQRSLARLFAEMNQRRPDWTYTLTLCMLEIYNEALRSVCLSVCVTSSLSVSVFSSLYLSVFLPV